MIVLIFSAVGCMLLAAVLHCIGYYKTNLNNVGIFRTPAWALYFISTVIGLVLLASHQQFGWAAALSATGIFVFVFGTDGDGDMVGEHPFMCMVLTCAYAIAALTFLVLAIA